MMLSQDMPGWAKYGIKNGGVVEENISYITASPVAMLYGELTNEN